MDCFPVRIVLEISEEVLQAVLLDKIHVAIMAFTKSKKESTNHQINGLYCSALRYCGMQLLYHYVPTPVDKKPSGFNSLYKSSETVGKVLKRRHSNL
jgi:hypothetical protein